MPGKFFHVTLTSEERNDLQKMLSSGKHAARKLMHARVLLLCDSGPEGPSKTGSTWCCHVHH